MRVWGGAQGENHRARANFVRDILNTMRGFLVRVGIDQAFGEWNAPIDPRTREFAYVPIPDGVQRRGLETTYADLKPALSRFPGVELPGDLESQHTHLDPDFSHLTYGDNGVRRGRGIAALEPGDFIAFYSGLAPIAAWDDPLVYALIGFYRVKECVRLSSVPVDRWHENAHTRRLEHRPDDVIVRGERKASGRLQRAIVIGEWRDRAYRVRRELLQAWGGLSCRDGYIQRSAVPPEFVEPTKFLEWFAAQRPELIATNNPAPGGNMRTLIYKRTHNGDPDESGCFGIHDCMGRVRAREYDAVIGVGGTQPWAGHEGIAEKITWIGIGPRKEGRNGRGPLVTFDHFRYFGEGGPRLSEHAPNLAAHIFGNNVRVKMMDAGDDPEVAAVLGLAKRSPASRHRNRPGVGRERSDCARPR